MLDFTRKLSPASLFNYAVWRITNSGAVTLRLRAGPRFALRSNFSENKDCGVASEIFVHDFYNDHGSLETNNVRLVVDLGANVGFSLLHFLHKYPSCCIIADEPHSGHVKQAERNLALDGSRDRVELHDKAAGAKNRTMYLSQEETSSSLSDAASAATIAVEVVDIFPRLLGERIDLLKMDIEGGEYEILADERFGQLNLGAVVMEWHSRGAAQEDRRWCEQRLQALKFVIEDIFTERDHGMFLVRPG
jgi:FkbM family methyltransferase